MQNDIIITCAVTGSGNSHLISEAVPITPKEIATEAIAAAQAGAAIVHIHVRDPATGAPSMEERYYHEVVDMIKRSNVDVIVNLTTGPGARYTPDETDPRQASPESTITSPESRVKHVIELKPELCSLDVATLNFGDHAFVNIKTHVERIAKLVQDAGVKPELEVFDLGHVRLAEELAKKGVITGTPLFQICLGIPWGASATPENLLRMRDSLAMPAHWSAFGISREQFPTVAMTAVMGGHVRVGLEDNLYISKGVLARGNVPLVEKAIGIVESLGGRIATVRTAREILGLNG